MPGENQTNKRKIQPERYDGRKYHYDSNLDVIRILYVALQDHTSESEPDPLIPTKNVLKTKTPEELNMSKG